ncbi:hypothetical protein CH370_11980 [Leptospira kmetyi]|nr:hypothetical protein CH370_11980 [Leptospira kmetyi]
MPLKILKNSDNDLFTIEVDENDFTVRLKITRNDVERIVSSKKFQNLEDCLYEANSVVASKLEQGFQQADRKRRSGAELVTYMTQFLGFQLPKRFVSFLLEKEYIRFNGWMENRYKGSDRLWFKKLIEFAGPSNQFAPIEKFTATREPILPKGFLPIAEFSDGYLAPWIYVVNLLEPVCPIYQYDFRTAEIESHCGSLDEFLDDLVQPQARS